MVSTKKYDYVIYGIFPEFLKKKKLKRKSCNQRKRRNQALIYIAAYDYT